MTTLLNQHGIAELIPPTTPDLGCAGGPSIEITVVRRSGGTIDLNGSLCGGSQSGSIAGDLSGFVTDVEAAFPSPS